ncbi:MAG: hypothetical protein U9Q81_07520 [Pseudomonadota bacterium]|nr:hypothetical protein [Pseudomonadota bacterium]
MAEISNDQALRTAIDKLDPQRQRILGAHFVQSVLHLSQDARINRAIEVANNRDASPAELEDAFRAAKGYAVKTYTACGKDTDWLAQADHFVAAAAAAALQPASEGGKEVSRAWKAAIQARMAKNCEMMEQEGVEPDTEAQKQYDVAGAFLG